MIITLEGGTVVGGLYECPDCFTLFFFPPGCDLGSVDDPESMPCWCESRRLMRRVFPVQIFSHDAKIMGCDFSYF